MMTVRFLTPKKMYVIASDKSERHYRIMKLDRMSYNLDVMLDAVDYHSHEVHSLLKMIHEGNKPYGLSLTAKACGLLGTCQELAFTFQGFVRFLHGHYLVLVTDRKLLGTIGRHRIYSVVSTTMIYIPSEKPNNQSHEDR